MRDALFAEGLPLRREINHKMMNELNFFVKLSAIVY